MAEKIESYVSGDYTFYHLAGDKSAWHREDGPAAENKNPEANLYFYNGQHLETEVIEEMLKSGTSIEDAIRAAYNMIIL